MVCCPEPVGSHITAWNTGRQFGGAAGHSALRRAAPRRRGRPHGGPRVLGRPAVTAVCAKARRARRAPGTASRWLGPAAAAAATAAQLAALTVPAAAAQPLRCSSVTVCGNLTVACLHYGGHTRTAGEQLAMASQHVPKMSAATVAAAAVAAAAAATAAAFTLSTYIPPHRHIVSPASLSAHGSHTAICSAPQ